MSGDESLSLGERTKRSVVWGVGLSAVQKVVSVAIALVLARLLPPEVFGQYATISAIILFAMAFSMDSFMQGIFFVPELNKDLLHRHLGFGIYLHVGLFAAVNLFAAGMLFFADVRGLAVATSVCSIALLLNIVRVYYGNILKHRLDWRLIRSMAIVSMLTSSGAAIVLALMGAGVYAYIAQNIINPIPYIVMFCLREKALFGVRFDLKAFGAEIRFGLTRIASGAARTAYQAVEGLAFPAVSSFHLYGLFNRAKGLAQLTSGWLSDQTLSIVYPALAKITPNTDASRRASALVLRVTLWSSVPVSVVCALAPAFLLTLFFGQAWSEATPYVRPALLIMTSQVLRSAVSMLLLTNYSAGAALKFDIVGLVLSLATLPLLFTGQPLMFAYTQGVVMTVLVIVAIAVLSKRGLFVAADLVRLTLPPLATLGVGLALGFSSRFADALQAAPLLTVAGACVATGLTMLVTALLLDRKGLASILGMMPGARWTRPMLGLG